MRQTLKRCLHRTSLCATVNYNIICLMIANVAELQHQMQCHDASAVLNYAGWGWLAFTRPAAAKDYNIRLLNGHYLAPPSNIGDTLIINPSPVEIEEIRGISLSKGTMDILLESHGLRRGKAPHPRALADMGNEPGIS